jgi:hypothetical protein
MRPLILLLAALGTTVSGAEHAVLTAKPATLELHRSLTVDAKNKGLFVGAIQLTGTPSLEVLGGDGVLVEAVDATGASLVNPDYIFDGKHQRVPLMARSIGQSTPAEVARQGDPGPQLLMYFLGRGAGTVITRLRITTTVILGDASRRVVTIGTWPSVIGQHPELPGAPTISADPDGQMQIDMDLNARLAWTTIWLEAAGKPVPVGGGGSQERGGRLSISRQGRVPDGAVVKAELTRVLGERTIEVVVGPWSFPGNGPPPASVSIPVEVPHAP